MIGKENLKSLKSLMQQEAFLKETLAESRKNWEDSVSELVARQKSLKNEIGLLKDIIDIEATEIYKETGQKSLEGGIGIRVSKKITYDKARALEYAKEKDIFLALDVKAFEKVAPAMGLDFVQNAEKITVTYPKEIKIDE